MYSNGWVVLLFFSAPPPCFVILILSYSMPPLNNIHLFTVWFHGCNIMMCVYPDCYKQVWHDAMLPSLHYSLPPFLPGQLQYSRGKRPLEDSSYTQQPHKHFWDLIQTKAVIKICTDVILQYKTREERIVLSIVLFVKRKLMFLVPFINNLNAHILILKRLFVGREPCAWENGVFFRIHGLRK